MTEVHKDGGYLFYVGSECMEDGCSRDIYNIVPEPKTIQDKLNFSPPATGYSNRRWIEKVMNIKFPDRYQPTLHGMQETYVSDEWNGID